MSDLQKLARPAISNWLLNSPLPSPTRFLSFWVLPGPPSPAQNQSEETRHPGTEQLLAVSASPNLPPFFPWSQVEIMPLQFITKEYRSHSLPDTPQVLYFWSCRDDVTFKKSLLWLMWANCEASQHLHLFLILGDWKDSMDLTCYNNQMVIFYWVNDLLQRGGQFMQNKENKGWLVK